jgi:NADH-quinone oxidoreductase subunit K
MLQENLVLLLLCLDYTSLVFILGFLGLLINRRNLLLMLLSLEFTFLASALNFILASSIMNLFLGSIYGIFVVLVVVADTAIGLSLVVLTYRSSKLISINGLISLRG